MRENECVCASFAVHPEGTVGTERWLRGAMDNGKCWLWGGDGLLGKSMCVCVCESDYSCLLDPIQNAGCLNTNSFSAEVTHECLLSYYRWAKHFKS